MKKLSVILFALACAPALAAAQSGQAPGQSGQVVEEIVAHVNNQIITKSEYERSKDQLRDEVKAQNPNDADAAYAAREKDVLRDLIDQQLLLEKAKDLSITGDTELIKQLDQMRKDMKLPDLEALQKEAEKQQISWEDFKQTQLNQIVTRKVINEEVGGKISLSKEEEEKFYQDHKSEMSQPELVQLNEILVAPKMTPAASPAPDPNAPAGSTEPHPAEDAAKPVPDRAALAAAQAKAEDLLKQIKAGANFEDIAKKSSDGPTAADGGTLGNFERGKLAKAIEDATFSLKPGEVTNVIQTKQGYVILKVVDHQQAGVPAFKDALPKIQDALYYQKMQPALRAYLTKLREDAYLVTAPGYDDTGKSPNQTVPVETASAKETDAKKLNKKKHKKLGII